MAIRRIEQVTCSLNLGLIYNLNYSFAPRDGTRITLTFINESGVYNTNFLNAKQPVRITIGSASFSMYPVSYRLVKGSDQKVIQVEFIDALFKLDNYYIELTGRATGKGIIQLGKPISQYDVGFVEDFKQQQLKEFMQFEDIEYTFQDFLNAVQSVVSVNYKSFISASQHRNSYTGTMKSVLDEWCALLGLTYYMSNDTLIIGDVTNLTINFPSIPNDAYAVEISESLEGTFDKTASIYAQIEGEPVDYDTNLEKKEEETVNIENTFKTSLTLKPLFPGYFPLVGSNTNNPTEYPDLNQVAAAMFGFEFWFLYNYFNEINVIHSKVTPVLPQTEYFSEIGLHRADTSDIASFNAETKTSIINAGFRYAVFWDEEVARKNYDTYAEYGRNICGRYYATDALSDLIFYRDCLFAPNVNLNSDPNEYSLTEINSASKFKEFQPPIGQQFGLIEGTETSNFKGIFTWGNRLIFKDEADKDYDSIFVYSADVATNNARANEIKNIFKSLVEGDALSSSFISTNPSVIFSITENLTRPSYMNNLVDNILTQNVIEPRFPNGIGVKVVKATSIKRNKTDEPLIQNPFPFPIGTIPVLSTPQPSLQLPNNPNLPTQQAPTSSSSSNVPNVLTQGTQTLTFKEEAEFEVYAQKYQDGVNKNTDGPNTLNRRFSIERVPEDTATAISLEKINNNTIKVIRDIIGIRSYYFNPEILNVRAKAKTFPRKSQQFSVNYFYDAGSTPIQNGLVGMSVSVGPNGVEASYEYSNEILELPEPEITEQMILSRLPNSILRKFNPNLRKSI